MLSVLFVCGKNRLRSPTAEHVFAGHPGLIVASAGVDRDADQVLTAEMVRAADLIVVMEPKHRTKLRQTFGASLNGQRVVCVNIPDDYTYLQPELVDRLRTTVTPHLALKPKTSPKVARARSMLRGDDANDEDQFDVCVTIPRRPSRALRP